MVKKFYAVKKGVKAGIYSTWNECKENVDGYSGAEYKSFQTEKDAKLYLGIVEEDLNKNMDIKMK